MIKKIILISFALSVGLVAFRFWFECVNFSDPVHFSAFDMSLKLQEAIHNDGGIDPNITRAFHNKLSLGIILVGNSYLHFWDVRFASFLFSPVLYFGIMCGFWFLLKSKLKHKNIIFFVALLLPFLEIFKVGLSYHIRLLIVSLPYFALSIYGLWSFIRDNTQIRSLVIILLTLFSFWYLSVYETEIFLNCFKG